MEFVEFFTSEEDGSLSFLNVDTGKTAGKDDAVADARVADGCYLGGFLFQSTRDGVDNGGMVRSVKAPGEVRQFQAVVAMVGGLIEVTGENTLSVTDLGKAIAGKGIAVETGIHLAEKVRKNISSAHSKT